MVGQDRRVHALLVGGCGRRREPESLPENAKSELEDIMNLAMNALKLMRQNLDHEKPNVELSQIIQAEKAINQTRKNIFTGHFERLEKGIYAPKIDYDIKLFK